jgi:GNAT superfamily N-acetyltransferase
VGRFLRSGAPARQLKENLLQRAPPLPHRPREEIPQRIVDPPHATIRVLSPADDVEWHYADVLGAELKAWDVRQSEALGFDADEVINVFYPDTISDIRKHSIPPDGRMLIAMEANLPVGCAAFRRLSSSACEAYNVYVRPSHRGRNVASTLLQRLLGDARGMGYRTMCLETATFMSNAHKLYKSFSFRVREPYRSVPDGLADVTIWMECTLSG